MSSSDERGKVVMTEYKGVYGTSCATAAAAVVITVDDDDHVAVAHTRLCVRESPVHSCSQRVPGHMSIREGRMTDA